MSKNNLPSTTEKSDIELMAYALACLASIMIVAIKKLQPDFFEKKENTNNQA